MLTVKIRTHRGVQSAFIVHGKISSREQTLYSHDTHVHCCDFHYACNINKTVIDYRMQNISLLIWMISWIVLCIQETSIVKKIVKKWRTTSVSNSTSFLLYLSPLTIEFFLWSCNWSDTSFFIPVENHSCLCPDWKYFVASKTTCLLHSARCILSLWAS